MTGPSIVFVCLGNICRSPIAEGLFRHMAESTSYDGVIDSAGTGSWHAGQPPDARAQQVLRRRDIDISGLRARQITPQDFLDFDLLLAMDTENLADLRTIAPHRARDRVHLFLDFTLGEAAADVPDPYYGGASGFENVCDLIERAAGKLLQHVAS